MSTWMITWCWPTRPVWRQPGSGLATYPDTQSRGNAVGVAVVDVPGRAVGGLLDLLDTDQVTWYQIIHESDAQAFRLLTSIIVLQ